MIIPFGKYKGQDIKETTKKYCSRCGTRKFISYFYGDKRSSDGKTSACKECIDIKNKKYDSTHLEEKRQRRRKAARKFRLLNPSKVRESIEKWRSVNKDKVKINYKKWASVNPDKCRGYVNKYRKSNQDKVKKWLKKYYTKRRCLPDVKLNCSMRTNINQSLNGLKKGRKWQILTGYSIDQLRKHLEKQFKPGMSWDNYGLWHIDHKIPISAFNFNTTEDIDFKKCWALDNLQPLWAKENILKKDKLLKPFQPSLRISI